MYGCNIQLTMKGLQGLENSTLWQKSISLYWKQLKFDFNLKLAIEEQVNMQGKKALGPELQTRHKMYQYICL